MADVSIFSFFAGCGILDLAFENNNFNIVFVNEFSKEFMNSYQYARRTSKWPKPIYGYRNDSAERYSIRRGKRSLLRMIKREKDKGRLVGFIGGPPCPDFSVGGKNAGANGKNGKLTRVYFNLICRCKPDFFVFENVKGLVKTEKHRRFYDEMKYKVQGSQYTITDKLLNAIEYGVPQFRERIMMVGLKKELLNESSELITNNSELRFNWEQHQRYHLNNINKITWPKTDEFVVEGELDAPKDIPLDLTVQHWFQRNQVLTHPNGQDFFRVKKGSAKILTICEGDTRGKSFKRLHRWRYSPTAAYGHNEVHLHPYKARRISVAEAMAIQSLPATFSLPDDISLSSKYKMIGNGVPYLLADAIAKTLMDLLEQIIRERDTKHGDQD